MPRKVYRPWKWEINLHTYHRQEANKIVRRSIKLALGEGIKRIEFIPGQGIHSPNHIPVLKLMVEEILEESGYHWYVDPNNPGKVIVNLTQLKTSRIYR